jgi:hypothetical protein
MKTFVVSKGFPQIESRRWRILIKVVEGVFLLIICASCSQTAPVAVLPPSLTPSPRVIHQATETISPTASKDDTETPEVNPEDKECISLKSGVIFNASEFNVIPQAVLEFLNSSGSIQDLDRELYSLGVDNQPLTTAVSDMTGNGINDVVVSIIDPQSENIIPGGKLLIFVCSENVYRLVHHQDSIDNRGAFGIRYLQDLNADGQAELVTSSPSCGAHTCFEDVQILGWDGEGFTDLLQGSADDLPSPDIRIIDHEEDGIFEIEVGSGGFNSVGAGPNRTTVRSWKYNQLTRFWEYSEDVSSPSYYRIHMIHDADTAARNGEFDAALIDYGRVVYDPTLVDWQNYEQEKVVLSAYALFKISVVHLILGEDDLASITFDLLKKNHPTLTDGHIFVELSNAFRSGFTNNGIAGGCEAAQDFAVDFSEGILLPLGSATYGYANPDYLPADICPWE